MNRDYDLRRRIMRSAVEKLLYGSNSEPNKYLINLYRNFIKPGFPPDAIFLRKIN